MKYGKYKADSRWNYKRREYPEKRRKKVSWTLKRKCGFVGWIPLFVAVLLFGMTGMHFMQILLKTDLIPDSLLEFAKKYPEAEAFVMEYPQKKDLDVKIDLTGEVVSGEVPLFIQWDERWGYKTYGSDCMGVTGCGPTCIAMAVCGLTGNLKWNPYEAAKYAEENGYYVEGLGTSWELMADGASVFGLKSSRGTVSEDYIKENLSSQTPMIASMLPGDFTYTGHFIVLTGMDLEGKVTVNDPNSRRNSEKTWPVETLVSQMAAIWRYSAEG